MNELIAQLTTSSKMRVAAERLLELLDTDRVSDKTYIRNLLIEMSSTTEFEGFMGRGRIADQGISILIDVLPNTIAKGNFTIGQLLKLVNLDSVLSIEEDVEIPIEEPHV